MAVERMETKLRLNIGELLNRQRVLFNNVKEDVYRKEQVNFLRLVIDKGLTIDEQIDYYSSNLSTEKDKDIPDNVHISEIKGQLSALKKYQRAKNFQEKYEASWQDFLLHKKTVEEHLGFLQEQAVSVFDEDLKSTITMRIREAELEKDKITNQIFANEIKFALEDKRVSLLQDVIDKTTKKRNSALAKDLTADVTAYDLTIQQLKGTLAKENIYNEIHNLQLQTLKGEEYKATDYLDWYNELITKSSTDDVGLNIDNIRYTSLKDYWLSKRETFLQDSQSGFFPLVKQEMERDLMNANTQFQAILGNVLNEKAKELEDITLRLEIEPYSNKLGNLLQDVKNKGVELLSKKIYDEYKKGTLGDTAAENIQALFNQITALNIKYNTNQQTEIQEVIAGISEKKGAVVGNQLRNYYNLLGQGKSPAEAWQIASQEKGLEVTAKELLERKPEEISKEIIEGKEKKYELPETKIPPTGPFQIPTGYEKISGAKYPDKKAQQAAYEDIRPDPTNTFLYGKPKLAPAPTPTPTPKPTPAPAPTPVSKPAPAPPKITRIYYKGQQKTFMDIPSGDLSYWQGQGWTT